MGGELEDFQLSAEREPRERNGAGVAQRFEQGRFVDPASAGTGHGIDPTLEPLLLAVTFLSRVEEIGGHEDLVVEPWEAESEPMEVRLDERETACDQGFSGGGGFEEGKSETFDQGGEHYALGGVEKAWDVGGIAVSIPEHGEVEGPTGAVGGEGKRCGIGVFLAGTGGARGDKLRLRTQPSGEQEGLGDVFPAQQPAGKNPEGSSHAVLLLQPASGFGAVSGLGGMVGGCSIGGIWEPGGPSGKMPPENSRLAVIDGGVSDDRGFGEQDLCGAGEGSNTGSSEILPAGPAIIEPPVVMMKEQGDIALRADADQFRGEDWISCESQIVGPDPGVGGAGAVEHQCETGSDDSADERGRITEIGEVAESAVDDRDQRDAAQALAKTREPGGVGGFATEQVDGIEGG